jgi:hypothetical protein
VIIPVFKTGGRQVFLSPVGSTPTRFRHFSTYRPRKSLANQFGFGRAICTTLEWASCITFVTTSPHPRTRSWWCGCPRDASVFVVLPPSSRRHPATSDRYAVSSEPADGSGCGSASERTPNSIVGPRLAAEPRRRSKHPVFITRELHCLLPGTARASPALPYRPRPSDCSSMSKANIP